MKRCPGPPSLLGGTRGATFVVALALGVQAFAGVGFSQNQNQNQGKNQALLLSCTGATCSVVHALVDAYKGTNAAFLMVIESDFPGDALQNLQTSKVSLVALGRSVAYPEVVRTRELTGGELVGTPFAVTGAAVYVHQKHPADSFTLDQVRRLFRFQVASWTELGFEADGTILREYRPEGVKLKRGSVPVRLYLSSDRQCTNDLIARRLLYGEHWPNRVALYDTPEALLDKIADDTHGVGITAWTSHVGVKALALKTTKEGPAIKPSEETIRNRTYPLSHYLYFYSLGQPKGAVKEFVVFALSEPGQRAIGSVRSTIFSLPQLTRKLQ